MTLLTVLGLILTAFGAIFGGYAIKLARDADALAKGMNATLLAQRRVSASFALNQATDALAQLESAVVANDADSTQVALHRLGHSAAALHAVDSGELTRLIHDEIFRDALDKARPVLGITKGWTTGAQLRSMIPTDGLEETAKAKVKALSPLNRRPRKADNWPDPTTGCDD